MKRHKDRKGQRIGRRVDFWILAGIALLILGALIFVTLQLLDQSERHVARVKGTKVRQRAVNEWIPRANECDLQAKKDFESNPNRNEIRYNQFGFSEEGFRQIGRMRCLQKLTLMDCDLRNEWLIHLEGLPLSDLSIDGTDLTSEGVDSVAKFKSLEYLSLARNPVDDRAIEKLSGLTHLIKLNLSETDVTDGGVKQVTQILPQLGTLNVTGCNISGRCLPYIATLKNLKILDFGQVHDIRPEEIRSLKTLKNLYRLNMRRCKLDDDTAKAFAVLAANLSQLEIDQNDLTDKSIDTLVGMKGLKLVRLGQTKITPEGFAQLRAKRPDCTFDSKPFNQAGIEI